MAVNFNQWFQNFMEFMKFVARLPPALLIMFGGGVLCFLTGGVVYRAAQWVFEHVIANPW